MQEGEEGIKRVVEGKNEGRREERSLHTNNLFIGHL